MPVETFGQMLRRLRTAAGISQPRLAARVPLSQPTLSRYEADKQAADHRTALSLDNLLGADGALIALVSSDDQAALAVGSGIQIVSDSDECSALELTRRIAASDVGEETLTQLERAFDDLAVSYPVTPPALLLPSLRKYLTYVSHIMDARKTLAEHRRLLMLGGWFSLLASTVHIDLGQTGAASARLRTSHCLAEHAVSKEIQAWCYETEAWRAVTDGDYKKAAELSQAAQNLAPPGSSIAIQATAQEGRAQARLEASQETYSAINRVHSLVSSLAQPDRVEHHYRYDPTKSVAYTATTLAWVGDPAGEEYARAVIDRLQSEAKGPKWPRRVASANLDLALTLLVSGRMDEASNATRQALESGCLVPSNYWRAAEVVATIEDRRLPEAKELRDAYTEVCLS